MNLSPLHRSTICLLAVLLLFAPAHAAEYFVSTTGSGEGDGRSPASAFATIQRGVDALEPGDTLTILPGEYRQHVRRENIGGPDADTVIRAQIPGTVLLRGDVPAPRFRKVDGMDFVYVADFEAADDIPAVIELDTLSILQPAPNPSELQYLPGLFHYDREAGKLYVSSSDWRPTTEHEYTVSVIPTYGLFLAYPRRVIIEGIAVTGYHGLAETDRHDFALGGTWGIFLTGAKDCAIRECRAYLNAQGIGINSLGRPGYRPGEFGHNVIDRCVAWANGSTLGSGDRGGITLVQARLDLVRDCRAFLNLDYGINIRGGHREHSERDKSRLIGNIAWGNGKADVKIKIGAQSAHTTEYAVAMHPSNDYDPIHCLLGTTRATDIPANNIVLDREPDLDMNAEFADPVNRDYRLQATSRFRGALSDGGDRGPYPYEPDIFYVSPDGDDAADGLSVANAWRTPARAMRDLGPGQTLYVEPGTYTGDLQLTAGGEPGKVITIRGRGVGPVVIDGDLQLTVGHVTFERLHFEGAVRVERAAGVTFGNCRFEAERIALQAEQVDGLSVRHCAFSDFAEAGLGLRGCDKVDLRGNLFDNRRGAGLRVDTPESIRYSDYNAYGNPTEAWRVAGSVHAVSDLTSDTQSPGMTDAASWRVAGPFARPVGPFRVDQPVRTIRLVQAPTVYSTSATTANIEWRASLPNHCLVAWGPTPECANEQWFGVDRFASFSLTGLEPGKTYYLRLKAMQIPRELTDDIKAEPVELDMQPIAFTTQQADPPPRTLYVAPDGNDAATGLGRDNAWGTIQHAANRVRPGDTVRIAEGTYIERVRIRVTGDDDRPITFACLPGQRVRLSGDNKKLNRAFIACGKRRLRFDGFYFSGFNREPLHNSNWHVQLAGNFLFYQSKDIEVSRCFADGRGGYSARFISAWEVERLVIENCVILNKMSGSMWLRDCPDLRMNHTVIGRPMITAFGITFPEDRPAVMRNNIITDMLRKKARHNIYLIYGRCPQIHDTCFLLREFGPEERHIAGDYTAAELPEKIQDPVFADPQFAGDPDPDGEGFAPDRMMHTAVDLDFNSFFATNPIHIERGIGLQREAFRDFHFNR